MRNSLPYFSQRVEPVTNFNKHLAIAIQIFLAEFSLAGSLINPDVFQLEKFMKPFLTSSINDCDVYEAIITKEPTNIGDRICLFEFVEYFSSQIRV